MLRADRQCFLELACVCNGNLKSDASGALPLDKEFEKLEFAASIMYFLLPVQSRGKGAGKKRDRDGASQGTNANGYGNGKKRTAGADDAPGKKTKVTRDSIPEALRGMSRVHPTTSRYASTLIWASAKLERNASSNISVASLAVTRLMPWWITILRVSSDRTLAQVTSLLMPCRTHHCRLCICPSLFRMQLHFAAIASFVLKCC